jgi:hypothetical protein
MTYREARMRYLFVLLGCLELGGCFMYVPGGLFARGDSCVPENYQVGERIRNNQTGKTGTIKELHGRSERCQDGARPILATVEND